MATVKELKNIIVELKVQLRSKDIPYGTCPYALFSLKDMSKRKSDCSTTDCTDCHNEFLRLYRDEVIEEVRKL